MIPRRLIRSVPEHTSPEVEDYWEGAIQHHLGWQFLTLRDPLNPNEFPITAPLWSRCTSGAQFAGLVRLEALWHGGGIWLDSDVEVYRSFAPLCDLKAFAAWEDGNTVPDAIMGAEPKHPAIGECLHLAAQRLGAPNANNTDWRTGPGAWSTGPGVTTTIFPGREDVLLLPPGSFYAVHYNEKNLLAEHHPAPFEFASHKWHASWL